MPELQPKAPPKPNSSPPQSASGASRPMNWFGFGAGPSDATPSGHSLGKASSATNLRPNSGIAPNLRPNSSHGPSSDSAQAKPSRPPQPASVPTPPKDKNRKDKEREKKDRLKKPQEPPPPSGWPGSIPGSFGGSRPSQSPQSPQMPGAMPPSSPSGQNFFSGFQNAFPQQAHKPPQNPPAGFPPPSVPPPPPGQQQPPQPAQPVGLAGALTNQLANVGYSLLDKLTHNTPNTRPK